MRTHSRVGQQHASQLDQPDRLTRTRIEGLHHVDFTIARLVYKLIGMRFRD